MKIRVLPSLILATALALGAPASMAASPSQATFVVVGEMVPDNGRPLNLADGSQMMLVSVSPASVTSSPGPSGETGSQANTPYAVFAIARAGVAVGSLPPIAVGEPSRIVATVDKVCIGTSGQLKPSCLAPDLRSYRTIQVVATGDSGNGMPGAYVVVQTYGDPGTVAAKRR